MHLARPRAPSFPTVLEEYSALGAPLVAVMGWKSGSDL